MVFMLEKKYANVDLEIELTSFIDSKQNVWFRGKILLRSLDTVNHEMLLSGMCLRTIK